MSQLMTQNDPLLSRESSNKSHARLIAIFLHSRFENYWKIASILLLFCLGSYISASFLLIFCLYSAHVLLKFCLYIAYTVESKTAS
jgi:hypothetical protein